jgi:CBS domain-containing protein
MTVAREIMEPCRDPIAPGAPVEELARRLFEERADGVCVVDAERLVGVVTAMDLLYKERRLHVPTLFFLLDAAIPLENPFKWTKEVERVAGKTVGEIMSRDLHVVAPDSDLQDCAAIMVDHHLTMLPVVADGRLLGVVTKHGMLKAAFGLGSPDRD